MKCRLNNKKTLMTMGIAGLVLMAVGAIAAYFLPDEMHLAARIAGFVSGLGTSLAVIGFVLLLRRARLGEERAKDNDLAMTDERGMAVAYKAQSAAAIAAVFALVVIVVIAMIRGDHLYMGVTSMLMCAVALVKLAAWHIYNRTM